MVKTNFPHECVYLALALLLQLLDLGLVPLNDGGLLLNLCPERGLLFLQHLLYLDNFLDITLVRLPHPVQDLLLGQVLLRGHLHLSDRKLAKLADVGQELPVHSG